MAGIATFATRGDLCYSNAVHDRVCILSRLCPNHRHNVFPIIFHVGAGLYDSGLPRDG